MPRSMPRTMSFRESAEELDSSITAFHLLKSSTDMSAVTWRPSKFSTNLWVASMLSGMYSMMALSPSTAFPMARLPRLARLPKPRASLASSPVMPPKCSVTFSEVVLAASAKAPRALVAEEDSPVMATCSSFLFAIGSSYHSSSSSSSVGGSGISVPPWLYRPSAACQQTWAWRRASVVPACRRSSAISKAVSKGSRAAASQPPTKLAISFRTGKRPGSRTGLGRRALRRRLEKSPGWARRMSTAHREKPWRPGSTPRRGARRPGPRGRP